MKLLNLNTEYTKNNIGMDKINRIKFQERLIKKFKMPLIITKVNYPELSKYNDVSKNIIQSMDKIISDVFCNYILFKILRITLEGPIVIMSVNKDSREVKKITVEIEEKHILGKCVEIEVVDKDLKAISRKDVGYSEKRCFLCKKYLKECMIKKTHKDNEIIQYITNKYREYVYNFSGRKI